MALEGMDADAVRSMAANLGTHAEELTAIESATNALVRHLHAQWSGGDADEFIGEWTSKYQPALRAAAQAVQGLATSAANNVAQQDSASSIVADSAVGGAAGVVTGGLVGLLLQHFDMQSQELEVRSYFYQGLNLLPGQIGSTVTAGLEIRALEAHLDQWHQGSGDVVGDAVGSIPEVGPAINFVGDGSSLMNDLLFGGPVKSDMESTGWDLGGLVPYAGPVVSGIKTHIDVDHVLDLSPDETLASWLL